MRINLTGKFAVAALLIIFVQGCVTTNHQTLTHLARPNGAPKVVLMPVDVTLGHMTAGGLFEPQAAWTEAGEKHVRDALGSFLRNQDVQLIPYAAPPQTDRQHTHSQIVKLHRVVGDSIRLHQFLPAFQLPTKKDTFSWTLGPDAAKLGSELGADYALFVFVKDSYATAGRAAAIVVAAILGVGIQGGVQIGYASLVDLNSGEIVWFNALGRASGDLRKPEPAKETVSTLMTSFPK